MAIGFEVTGDFTFPVSEHSGDVRYGPGVHGTCLRDNRYLSQLPRPGILALGANLLTTDRK